MFENKPKKSESKWYYDQRVGFGKYGVRLARLFFFLFLSFSSLHSTSATASSFSVCVEKRLANDLTVIIDFKAMTIFLHRAKRQQNGMCKKSNASQDRAALHRVDLSQSSGNAVENDNDNYDDAENNNKKNESVSLC